MTRATFLILLAFVQGTQTFSDIFLSNLDAQAGITISSLTPDDFLGNSARSAGDFNGDGYDDVIIGSFGAKSSNRIGVGAAYIIFGSKNGLSNMIVPSGLPIYGPDSSEVFGWSVSFAGDVNGDKIDDVIIGDDSDQGGRGIAFVIYGSKTPPAIIDLASPGGFDPSQGFAIIGASPDAKLGASVSWAGDVNNDKIDDIIVGAPGSDGLGGAAYIIFGKKGTRGNIFASSLASSAEGFAILGAGDDSLGSSVSNAGDVDGDGVGDIILGASAQDSLTGAVYIIFGKKKGSAFTTIDLSKALSPSAGFIVKGTSSSMGQFGIAVGCAGDFNKDGFSDVVVGAIGDNNFEGAVYVLFGNKRTSLSSGVVDTARAMKIRGVSEPSYFGQSVNGAGDINGDGIDDIIMGASLGGSDISGVVYVIFGSETPVPEINLNAGLDAQQGFSIIGASPTGYLGISSSNAGDVNGDGMSDLVVGAYGVNQNAGAVYILFTPRNELRG